MSSEGISGREFARRAGCDVKQVQRALKSGKLKADANGKLDPAQLETGWRKPIRSSKPREDKLQMSSRVSSSVLGDDETPTQAAARLVREMGAAHDLAEAIRIKENYNALLKKLEYDQKEGSLIELEIAQHVIFEEFRAQRDSWLNWPMRVGPLLAADLGLEADKVVEILTAHVHKHISELGEPDANFAQREG